MEEKEKKRLGELLKLLASGEVFVLKEISDRMESILRSIGNIYYRNRADIEDAIGNLYIKLYDKAKKFREDKNAYAWIISVFQNSIKSNLRSMRLEREALKEVELSVRAANEVDEKYIDNHLLMREVFDKLTKEEQQLVIYYYWGKLSIREVAKILHVSKSAIDRKLKKVEEKVKNFYK